MGSVETGPSLTAVLIVLAPSRAVWRDSWIGLGWLGLVGACEVTRPRPAAEPPASERQVGCQRVATAARSISRATVSGCEISPRCEALILATVAWARAAMIKARSEEHTSELQS